MVPLTLILITTMPFLIVPWLLCRRLHRRTKAAAMALGGGLQAAYAAAALGVGMGVTFADSLSVRLRDDPHLHGADWTTWERICIGLDQFPLWVVMIPGVAGALVATGASAHLAKGSLLGTCAVSPMIALYGRWIAMLVALE